MVPEKRQDKGSLKRQERHVSNVEWPFAGDQPEHRHAPEKVGCVDAKAVGFDSDEPGRELGAEPYGRCGSYE